MALRDLIPWSRRENRLVDDFFRGFGAPFLGGTGRSLAWLQVKLGETTNDIRVLPSCPGLDEKDVDISLEEGMLTLRGEKTSEVEDKDRGYSERSYGSFERRIGLPKGIDRDGATATFRNGVLTVTLPKAKAANENVRRIAINAQAA